MSNRKRKPFSQIAGDTENSVTSKKSRSANDESNFQRRAGTINRMTLRNFMCHSLLEVNFENNISFVIGKNGSGKSAILTALIIGLGGKATLTNRGSAVRGFVKAGKSCATIEIELYNEGPMAYRPNFYGNRIYIIRNLNANGGGSYKVKSEKGEIVSTKSSEVHNITINLNIQVDNPICILNQDTSRNFLSSNDPKNKFSLFMKATKLEALDLEYKKIQANKKDSEVALKDKERNFNKLKNEIMRLNEKIVHHRSITSLQDKKTLLHRELIWAQARDVEDELEVFEKKFNGIEKKLNDFKISSDRRVENLKNFKEEIQSLEQQMLEIKEQIEVQKRPQVDIRTQIDQLNRNISAKKREKYQISTTIQNSKSDVETLQREIQNSKENMSKVEQQKMERIKNLADLQNKLKGLDDHLETSKNDLFLIRGDLSRKEEDERNLKQEIYQIDQKINNENKDLNALSAGSGDELLLYGREMPRVKHMISQYRNKFKHEPKGPLGSYIKLKDKKWTVAVEGYIGPGLLRAFIVDNKQDNQQLREIFNKTLGGGVHPQIITSKFIFNKHDVSRNLVQEPRDCVCVYNAIEIDDPVVSNAIVDNCSPENILLIPSDARAQDLLSDRRKVPRNCTQGITIKGDKYYPDPNYRSYASSYHRAQFLQVDTKEHIKQLRQKIEEFKSKKQVVVNQLQEFRKNMTEQISRKQQLEEKVRKVTQARTRIRQQLEELNATAEPEMQNVQFLEQELEDCKRTLNQKTAELDRVEEEIKDIKSQINEKERNCSQLRDSTKDLEERMRDLNKEIREKQTKQKEIATSDEFDKKRIGEFESRVNEAKAQVQKKQAELEKCTSEAESVGERLPKLRKVIEINNEITEVNNNISKIKSDTENITDVIEKHTALKEKYNQSADIMKGLVVDMTELSLALEKRCRHYKLTEEYFVRFMKYSFKTILEYRQFKGSLEININDKKLDLIVIPQHGSQGHTTTSNLSGGERSFSTVAFLYALWQCMELPFYFLDEFDVYMDKLNRTKVIEILLHHAKSKPQLQFVFLTPQDVSFVENSVSILRLADPERFNA